uniref:Increased DNA methylation 1 C-terminal domain-containing protein n=1 Tax=Nelumbo nucifera TaxID=4432 RepID=A0A822XW76_NELNU|nr:TPA_asm: hypothetical protein HUJ06_027362 [Nelumbo nucifera]
MIHIAKTIWLGQGLYDNDDNDSLGPMISVCQNLMSGLLYSVTNVRRSSMLVVYEIVDYELPKGKWFCCEDCSRIHSALQNLVLRGAEIIPAPVSHIINKKLEEKGLTDEAGNDVQWQLLSGKVASPDHHPLLSKAAAIFLDCFDPIVMCGRDLVPIMVYGRNLAGQEFGGMYSVVLTVNSIVVSAGILRIFCRVVAELPLVATSRENQGKV